MAPRPSRKRGARLVRAITDPLWQRDRLQMQAVDALLTAVEPSSGPAPGPGRRRRTGAPGWAGFRSVLCAIDFSPHSARALRYAAAIARRGRAVLTVVHVHDPLLVAAAAAALHDRELVTRSGRELQAFIHATIAPRANPRLRVKRLVSVGQPPDQILEAAATSHADLVVLGTRGATGANRLFLGSTTLSVLQRATVPVLAIPPGARGAAGRPTRSWPGPRIVAALELDRRAGHDVDDAARIAAWFGASLQLVHVVDDVAAPAWLRADLGAHDRRRLAAARRRIDVLAARSRRQVATDTRVVSGRVADGIAAVAAEAPAGLLMTALRDRRGWFGAKRGSVSYHVLSQAVMPVLACPPQWRPR